MCCCNVSCIALLASHSYSRRGIQRIRNAFYYYYDHKCVFFFFFLLLYVNVNVRIHRKETLRWRVPLKFCVKDVWMFNVRVNSKQPIHSVCVCGCRDEPLVYPKHPLRVYRSLPSKQLGRYPRSHAYCICGC